MFGQLQGLLLRHPWIRKIFVPKMDLQMEY